MGWWPRDKAKNFDTQGVLAPDFAGALILAIELLKKGAPAVDIIHWHIRLRWLDGAWEIGPIPQHAYERHATMFTQRDAPATPIAGEEGHDDPNRAADRPGEESPA